MDVEHASFNPISIICLFEVECASSSLTAKQYHLEEREKSIPNTDVSCIAFTKAQKTFSI